MSVTQPFPFPVLGGGLDQHIDALLVDDQHVVQTQDVSFLFQRATKRFGTTNDGTALAGVIQARFDYFTNQKVQYPIAITSSKLYYETVSDVSDIWTPIFTFTNGTPTVSPSWENFNGTLVVTNGANNIVQWAAVGNATPLTGNPPVTARLLKGYQNRLLAADVVLGGTEYPFRIMWSDFNNINQWASGDAGLVDLADTNDGLQGFARVGTQMALLRRNSCWIIQPAPAPFFYSFQSIVQGNGCIASGSIQESSIGAIYLGDGMLYAFNSVSSQPIGIPALPILQSVNYGALGTIQSAKNDLLGEYYLALPINGATSPNVVLVLNFLQGYITLYNLPLTAVGTQLSLKSDTWAAPGTWAQDLVPWSAGSNVGQPIFVGALSSQPIIATPNTYDDNGVAIKASFTTKTTNFNQPGIKNCDRVQLVFNQEVNGTLILNVGTSDNGTAIRTSSPYRVFMTGQTAVYVETDDLPAAEWFNFQISNDEVDVNFALVQIYAWWHPRGTY